ncbi:Hcp family type VI secretion system effector [Rahnella sp. PCH160]|uniref:Hcp family type VI secretion system effector n=1 Tax=Rahnella sp. PCH160 TaxID=3447928 RepID=UPI0039FD3C01
MANMIYLTITGKKQGLISAGCSTADSIGNKYQLGHRDQIMVVSFEHALTRSQNVNHGPISFIKFIDKSSPLFGMAISNNEELELKFDFYRTSSSGGYEIFYTVTVRKAFLHGVSVIYPHTIDHSGNQPEEMISVNYQNITWEHHIAGTAGYSIWDERIF